MTDKQPEYALLKAVTQAFAPDGEPTAFDASTWGEIHGAITWMMEENRRVRAALMQLFTDPENQPTQYGTVTVEYMQREIEAEREACAALVWPKLKIWSEEEQTAMVLAFNQAQEKHGWYETLMAVGASLLKPKAEAIRARGDAK